MDEDNRMSQLELYQRDLAETLRDKGMSRVLTHESDFVERMVKWVEWHAEEHGEVTANDLHKHCDAIGASPDPSAFGVVFNCAKLRDTGRMTKAIHPASHGRKITVWAARP